MMSYTHDYDTAYDPALPVAEVEIKPLGEANGISLVAIIDSGADGTIIPLRFLKELKARQAGQKWMRGVDGLRHLVDIYEVTIQLGSYIVPKIYAVADRQNQGMILGRDVLNYFIVTLNGLAQVMEISD